LYVLARTSAGINKISKAQFFHCRAVKIHALTLIVWRKFSADIRAFAPFKAEPLQILEHRRDESRLASIAIQIVVPQYHFTLILFRPHLRNPKSPRMAEMQESRRRRRETTAVWRTGDYGLWIHHGEINSEATK
jgi:hypothetical protein